MRACLIALSLLSIPAAVAAQQQPAPPPPPPPTNSRPSTTDTQQQHMQRLANEIGSRVLLSGRNPEAESYAASQQVAACLARRAKDQAGTLVDSANADYAALKKALQGRYSLCMSSAGDSVNLVYVNSALVEEFLRARAPGLQDRTVPADVTAAKAFYASPGGLTLESLARCLAVYSPGLSYRVLAAPVGSPQEMQAVTNLYAQTPECGMATRPGNATAGAQRTALAMGLYDWVKR